MPASYETAVIRVIICDYADVLENEYIHMCREVIAKEKMNWRFPYFFVALVSVVVLSASNLSRPVPSPPVICIQQP